jgi:hypothetical protein
MGGYGEKWGRSRGGELAWTYLFQDEFFSSIENHVGELILSKETRSEASLDVLGELTDPSPSGQQYDFNNRVYCPVCGSADVKTSTEPESSAERIVLPVATHHHWDKQSEDTRHQLVKEALQRHGWPTKPTIDA